MKCRLKNCGVWPSARDAREARLSINMLCSYLAALAWPALFTDCAIFPELGEAQKRPTGHVAMSLLCEPHPPTSFEWCMEN